MNKYANQYLISHEILNNNQILIRHKIPDENLYQNKSLQKITNKTPTIIGSFILSYSKQLVNIYIHIIDGFNNKIVQYVDTDSLYIHYWHIKTLEKYNLIGSNLYQSKNDINKSYYINKSEIRSVLNNLNIIKDNIEYHMNLIKNDINLNNNNINTIDNIKLQYNQELNKINKLIDYYIDENNINDNNEILYKTNNIIIDYKSIGPKNKIYITTDFYNNNKETHYTLKGL